MIRPSRHLTELDLAIVRGALVEAGIDPAPVVDRPTPATRGRDLWDRSLGLLPVWRVLRHLVLPAPPRQPGDTVAVTLTLPADLADAYADAESAGAPGRSILLQRAMREELAARWLPCPPPPPPPPARVAAAAAARVERRERDRDRR